MSFFEKLLMPHLEWIQLEVSGLCNASCFYCPHTTHKKFWEGKNITLEDFQKIVPFLKKVKLLYLQGWGEPFCNPDFFNFVEIAKKNGCQIGTTTNGMLLKESHLNKMVDLGVDIIAFSLTGIKKNDVLREGTKVEKVFEVIKTLNEIKREKKALYPKVHIAYMLLKSNYDEIDNIPQTLSLKGVEHIQVSFLDYIPIPELEKEVVRIETEEEFEVLKNKAIKIKEIGKKLGVQIFFNLPHPFKRNKICSENPLKAFFINSLGYISPCVYTGIPSDNVEKVYFGNIKEKSIFKIWSSKQYKEFRKKHSSEPQSIYCKKCPKLRVFCI